MNDNSITVGIPFYNDTNATHLKSAIESVLNQSRTPDKIHLIQDGDVPNSIRCLVGQYISNHLNCEHIKLRRVNLPTALNFSISKATTRYYARMDADDICFSDRLEKQIEYLDENPEIDILGAWAVEFSKEADRKNGYILKLPYKYEEIKTIFHYRNPLIHPTVVFRKSVFNIIGNYNPEYYMSQDLELWARSLKKDIKISNLQEPLLYYRIINRNKKIIGKRKLQRIRLETKARSIFRARSFRLKLLKILSIIFRFQPNMIIRLGYKYLR